jgi:hypothetical protein
MARYLRIAASVYFALIAVAFVGLWVRSYYWHDGARGPIGRSYTLSVQHLFGVVVCAVSPESTINEWASFGLQAEPHIRSPLSGEKKSARTLGFTFDAIQPSGFYAAIPHWFLAAGSFGFAALFAFKRTWRFTARGLLIATTLLGGVLGLAIYLI